MIDKQRTSTANDLERLPATLQGDVEARLVNRYLVAKSFQRYSENNNNVSSLAVDKRIRGVLNYL